MDLHRFEISLTASAFRRELAKIVAGELSQVTNEKIDSLVLAGASLVGDRSWQRKEGPDTTRTFKLVNFKIFVSGLVLCVKAIDRFSNRGVTVELIDENHVCLTIDAQPVSHTAEHYP